MRNLMKKNITKQYRNRLVLRGRLGILISLLLAACGGPHHHLKVLGLGECSSPSSSQYILSRL